jgi:cytosine/adenosine deaminase-related metal-dependent hydrolase
MAGLTEVHGPEDDNFWTWREVMYRFLAQMTPDDIEAVAALAYVEMLEAGFTAVGEFHISAQCARWRALCRSRRDRGPHRRRRCNDQASA